LKDYEEVGGEKVVVTAYWARPERYLRGDSMRVEFDKDLDIMYLRLREGKYAFSEEINENVVIDLAQWGAAARVA
jgi:hypothetical protein